MTVQHNPDEPDLVACLLEIAEKIQHAVDGEADIEDEDHQACANAIAALLLLGRAARPTFTDAAARTLAYVGGPQVVATLRHYITKSNGDPDTPFLLRAVKALGYIGPEAGEAFGELQNRLSTEVSSLNDAIRCTLASILTTEEIELMRLGATVSFAREPNTREVSPEDLEWAREATDANFDIKSFGILKIKDDLIKMAKEYLQQRDDCTPQAEET